MIRMSLLEKIKHLILILKDNSTLMIIVGIIMFLAFLVLFACRKKSNIIKLLFIFIYIVIISSIIFMFHGYIASLFDYLIENIIDNLLFPNLAIYVAVLLFINIVVLISIFNNRVKYYIKSINIVYFIITHIFLYLIINNIIENNVDVYQKLSIYTNQNLLILIELSMQLFVIWIVVLLIIKFIDYLILKNRNKISINNNSLVVDEAQSQDSAQINELIEYVPIKKKRVI